MRAFPLSSSRAVRSIVAPLRPGPSLPSSGHPLGRLPLWVLALISPQLRPGANKPSAAPQTCRIARCFWRLLARGCVACFPTKTQPTACGSEDRSAPDHHDRPQPFCLHCRSPFRGITIGQSRTPSLHHQQRRIGANAEGVVADSRPSNIQAPVGLSRLTSLLRRVCTVRKVCVALPAV
ncbi:hypothetical protein BU16DRAFT_141906 [Lophium mytilinum]|uniref:Uncharacterized protein n=1 Tax=Lophium mytilinum TaxID=390894 RepID=A0A6A6QF61_9PEZI|nr:hypothetical protein BU16DRAFT_141906 [Lophium mytilinum]